MSIGRRDDATTATRSEWLPIVQQAAADRSTRRLPKPPLGIAHRTGAYYTRTSTQRNDGTVRRSLKWVLPGERTVLIGSYTEGVGYRNTFPVGKVITLACGRQVVVALVAGLPYPVPVIP